VVVTITGPSASTQIITLSDIASGDITNAVYRVRSKAGGPTSDGGVGHVDRALSIRSLLQDHLGIGAAGIIGRVNFTVPHTSRRSTPLGPDQLGPSGQNTFENGLMPALYSPDGSSIAYVRPLVAGDPNDTNTANDDFQVAAGSELDLTVTTSAVLLRAQVKASQSSTTVQKPVSFAVNFDGHPDTSGLSYAWTFDDGSMAIGPSPTKTWTAPCTRCRVTVTITGVGIQQSTASTIVDVRSPHLAPSADPTTGTDGGASANPHAPNSGPNRGHGTTTNQDPRTRPGTTIPGKTAVATTDAGAVTVTGTVLVRADGTIPPPTISRTNGTLDQAPAAARSSRAAQSWAWLWLLLVPLALAVGATAELRPWRKQNR
jgi:hypothetical protein